MFGSPTTRRIWTDIDNLILVYIGSAAEFPLLEVNEWLFFTGRLPEAPIKRLVETLVYNRRIFELPLEQVPDTADAIRRIHTQVEKDRSRDEGDIRVIPNRGYIQVGAMLIDYGILGREYLDDGRAMSEEEKESYYQDQKTFYQWMGVQDLPETYPGYLVWRAASMRDDLKLNPFTEPLFKAYRKDLGAFRYWLLTQFMAYFVPEEVRDRAGFKRNPVFGVAYRLYPRIRKLGVSWWVHRLLLRRDVRQVLYDK